jgi:two-component system chemotaxis response regulator CheY
MKALVVDDSSTMRKILASILKESGVEEVFQATDGAEAVVAAAQPDIGLILMDWNMPNKTGFEALKEIRAAGRNMPIFMVTTEAEKSRVIEALQAGANNYIVKPFRADQVIEKVRALAMA